MKPSIKLLMLTSDFGEGHQQVADAISQALELDHPAVECRTVNIIAHLHPRLHAISRNMFLHTVQKLPSLYGYLFRKTSGSTASAQMLNELSHVGLKRLKTLLQDEQPDLVVSTFPFASGAMSYLREEGLTDVPLVTVITDHTVHQAWIHPATNLYLVGSLGVKEGLIRCGVPGAQIEVTGIPVRPAFEKTYNKHRLREQHGLSPSLPAVLILGGGFGMFADNLFDTHQLNRLPFPVQLIVICGRNEKAKAAVERQLRSSRHRVFIHGYVAHMHEWMAMSDLIVTKPGGVTTAEAMALHIPMLLCNPIPGQEEDNLLFLVRSGAAKPAASATSLAENLQTLLDHPLFLAQMERCAVRNHLKQAARAAASSLLQVVQQPSESECVLI